MQLALHTPPAPWHIIHHAALPCLPPSPVFTQVHGDVFRPPQASSLLSTYVGVGVQIFGMLVITTVFALLGFLSPANRGGLMTAMVLMFVFMGLLAGYTAGRYCS